MKNGLINYCRYYKGEKDCPFDDTRGTLWNYERSWCEMQAKNDAKIDDLVLDYNLYGLSGFEPYDGVPISLKALLFNRFASWISADVAEFKRWYNDIYLNAGRDTVTSKLN